MLGSRYPRHGGQTCTPTPTRVDSRVPARARKQPFRNAPAYRGRPFLVRCAGRRASPHPARPTGQAPIWASASARTADGPSWRSEERRVGKEVSVRVDLGGRRIIKKKRYRILTKK